MFVVEFSKELIKIQRENKVMFETVIKKIREIKENPEHYKPLRYVSVWKRASGKI